MRHSLLGMKAYVSFGIMVVNLELEGRTVRRSDFHILTQTGREVRVPELGFVK